jgi:hypothetical protein
MPKLDLILRVAVGRVQPSPVLRGIRGVAPQERVDQGPLLGRGVPRRSLRLAAGPDWTFLIGGGTLQWIWPDPQRWTALLRRHSSSLGIDTDGRLWFQLWGVRSC